MLLRIKKYLVAAKVSLNAKIVVEKSSLTQQTEIIVETMKEFEDKSHFLIARSLKDMVDDVICFRAVNPTLEAKKIYKKARIACAETLKKNFKNTTK